VSRSSDIGFAADTFGGRGQCGGIGAVDISFEYPIVVDEPRVVQVSPTGRP